MTDVHTPHHHESEYDRVMRKRLFTVPVWCYWIVQIVRVVFIPVLIAATFVAVAWFSYKNLTAPEAYRSYMGNGDQTGEIVWVDIAGEEILFKDLTKQQKLEAQSFRFGGYASPNAEEELRQKALKRKPKK